MIETIVSGIIPQNDEQRLEALRKFEILYTTAEEAFDNITQMMAEVFNTPMAFISLVDKENVFYKSQVGPFGRESINRKESLCSLTILGNEPLIIEDASEEACFVNNPYVAVQGGIRFYAGAPLITKEGYNIGTVCIVDIRPRPFFENEKQLLLRFAKMVMHEIEVRHGALSQIQTAEEVVKKNEELRALSHQLELDKERFDLVAKATQDAIWDWNLLTNEIWWNEGFKELFGYRQEEIEPTIDSWYNRVHPDDREWVINGIHKVIGQGGKNWSAEYRFRKRDGTYAVVFDRGYALHDTEGKPYRMLGSMQDITEERKAAEILEQRVGERTRELKQVNEQLKQFTYSASHDLQEPLRKISYFVDRLLGNMGPALDEDSKRMAERIQHTIYRMRSLIDDLLNYSNTTMGVIGFEEVDLNDTVKGVLDDMEATIIEKNASIDLHTLPTVRGDQRQLRQLFQNLVSNALKYHRKGIAPHVLIVSHKVKGEEIKADIPQSFREHTYHQVQVKDNGIGFDPDDAERIFRLFQRLHGKAEYEGTGVGLAIVQKVVENHGGYIWSESTPGEGATFNVLLPTENKSLT